MAASGALALAGCAALAVLLAGRFDEVTAALGSVSVELIFILAGLQATIYLCRVSSWNVALRCSGAGLCPDRVRAASGLAFTTNLVAPGYVGAALRLAVLRRLGRDKEVGVGQLAMIDLMVLAVEATFLIALAIPLVAVLAPGYLWLPLGLLVALAAGVALLGPLRARLGHLSWARSLAVFGSWRELVRFAAPLCTVVMINPIRFWIALAAVGANVGLGIAVVAFIMVSVVGALPLGGAQAGIGGLGVVFASGGAGVVVGAGVVLAATAAIGAAIYLVAVALIWALGRGRSAAVTPLPA